MFDRVASQLMEHTGDVESDFCLTFQVGGNVCRAAAEAQGTRSMETGCWTVHAFVASAFGARAHALSQMWESLLTDWTLPLPQIEYETGFGELSSISLGTYNGDTPVTNLNREEFVKLYVKNLLSDRVELQYEAFSKVGTGWFHRKWHLPAKMPADPSC